MIKNKIFKKALSGILVFAFLLQPMGFQAQESLTRKASNVSILVQEPMNELFQQDAKTDAAVENLEYTYWFNENKGDILTADVDVTIDMIVSGTEYEIEADGEVLGEKLSSGKVLWMGPLESEIEINDVEYLVLLGFSKLDKLVQISVTIQSKDGNEEIEPVMFSFGDSVITEDVYQEICENQENVTNVSNSTSSGKNSTYVMSRGADLTHPQLEGGGGGAYTLLNSITTNFTSGPTGEIGQKLYGYFDEENDRVSIAIRSYCSGLEEFYSSSGYTITSIESMKYTLERGTVNKSEIGEHESFDFNAGTSNCPVFLEALFSDGITMTGQPVAEALLGHYIAGKKGYLNYDKCASRAYLELKFGVVEYANFDSINGGMPIIFSLHETATGYTGKHDYILSSSITYRSMVHIGGETSSYYTTYYNSAKDASFTIRVDLD